MWYTGKVCNAYDIIGRNTEGRGFFYGAENRNGHPSSPKRSAGGIVWEKGLGIAEAIARRCEKNRTKSNAEGGKAGGAGK